VSNTSNSRAKLFGHQVVATLIFQADYVGFLTNW